MKDGMSFRHKLQGVIKWVDIGTCVIVMTYFYSNILVNNAYIINIGSFIFWFIAYPIFFLYLYYSKSNIIIILYILVIILISSSDRPYRNIGDRLCAFLTTATEIHLYEAIKIEFNPRENIPKTYLLQMETISKDQ